MPPAKKYDDFTEGAPVTKIGKKAPWALDTYISIACPHCKTVFVELTQRSLSSAKASQCKRHLRVCPEYKGSVAPAPKRAKPTPTPKHDDRMVTIYKLVYKPENRAVYTGRTNNINERFKQHAQRSSKCRLVRNAIRRHGVRQYTIEPIVRCHAADADANESYYIMANNTLHPNGYNLRHGSKAGENSDDEMRVAASVSGIVPFSNARDELHAHMEATQDLADICEDLEDCSGVDEVCRNLLRDVHPDRAGERNYSAAEVSAMLNAVRESVRA